MSVMQDASGRRSVQLDIEVPGIPEQVWHAIATGPGVTSWFVPTDVDEREGGAVAFHLGPDMESLGSVAAWEPPRRFAYEERDWAPNAPPLASEFTIQARGGGRCVIRLVGVYPWAGRVSISISLYLFGDDARDVARRDEPRWHGWLERWLDQPAGESARGSSTVTV